MSMPSSRTSRAPTSSLSTPLPRQLQHQRVAGPRHVLKAEQQAAIGSRQMRLQGNRFLEMMDRLAEKTTPYEQAGIGTMRLGAFWVTLQSPLIAENCLVVLSLRLQNRA